MAISLDDAMALFRITRAQLRDPLDGTNPLLREINEALAAGLSEDKVSDFLVSQFRDAKERVADRLHDAARYATAAKITAIHREQDRYR
jgi:hypothetical protein